MSKETDTIDKEAREIGSVIVSDIEMKKFLDEEVDKILAETDIQEEKMMVLLPIGKKNFHDKPQIVTVVGFGDVPESYDDREKAFTGLGVKLTEEIFYPEDKTKDRINPVAVMHISEAYYKHFKKDSKDAKEFESGKTRLQDHPEDPDRREGIIVSVNSLDGRCFAKTIRIIRDPKTDKVLRRELDDDMNKYEGEYQNNLVRAYFRGIAMTVMKQAKESK